jgi:hypothetical protein
MGFIGLLQVRQNIYLMIHVADLYIFSDDFPVVGQHALNVGIGVSAPFTVENCIDTCNQYGFTLAGMESGNQCCIYRRSQFYHYFCLFLPFSIHAGCSSVVGLGSVPVTSGCNLPCQGNTTELCGGQNFINIYIKNYEPPPTVLPGYGTWVSTGCYRFDTVHFHPADFGLQLVAQVGHQALLAFSGLVSTD